MPSSAPSTAGLMEAILTYTSTTDEGLDADDGTVTPTPGNPATGMDVDNDPPPVIRFHYRVLCIMSHVCEQDRDPPPSLFTPPPSQVKGPLYHGHLSLTESCSLSPRHAMTSCLSKTAFWR